MLEVGGLKQHVEFLSPQNGAWKWGPTWRQTPFLTPGILGNSILFEILVVPASLWPSSTPKVPSRGPASGHTSGGFRAEALGAAKSQSTSVLHGFATYLDRQNRWVSKVTFKPSALS